MRPAVGGNRSGYGIDGLRQCRIVTGVFAFVETRLFTQLVHEYLSDDEYAALQHALMTNPKAGDLIRGSGGARKLR